jgi:hypothetical protein
MTNSKGFGARTAAIVKPDIQSHLLQDHDSYRNDTYAIWNVFELCMGILVASLPPLRQIFRNLLETTKTLSASRKGAVTKGATSLGNGSARRNYYRPGNWVR